MGSFVHPGTIAVDPNVIPLGSSVYIEDLGYFTAEDTGSGVIGNHVDVWFNDCQAALDWGRQIRNVYRVD